MPSATGAGVQSEPCSASLPSLSVSLNRNVSDRREHRDGGCGSASGGRWVPGLHYRFSCITVTPVMQENLARPPSRPLTRRVLRYG